MIDIMNRKLVATETKLSRYEEKAQLCGPWNEHERRRGIARTPDVLWVGKADGDIDQTGNAGLLAWERLHMSCSPDDGVVEVAVRF